MRYNRGMKTKPLTFLLALTFLISGSTTVNAKPKFDVKSTPSNQIEIDKYKALVKKPPMIIF